MAVLVMLRFTSIIAAFKRAWKAFAPEATGDKLASLAMRWARPIFFVLMTVMLVYGWRHPDELGTYFEAMAKAPEWLSNIITIMVLGLAVEKGITRPLSEVVKAVKGKD